MLWYLHLCWLLLPSAADAICFEEDLEYIYIFCDLVVFVTVPQ